jgi:uncharacterized membrane protein
MEHINDDPQSRKTHEQLEHAKIADNSIKISKNTLLAAISYVGPLVIISYLVGKDDSFVKFHIKQGLVLLSIEVALWLLVYILPSFWRIWHILNIVTVILSALGIFYVIQNKQKELPVVGDWAKYFKI